MDSLAAADVSTGRPARSRLAVVGGLIGAIVGGLLVAVLVVVLVATQLLGFHAFAVASESMAPTLHRGDLVVTRPVAVSSVNQGDIVAFVEGDTTEITVVHRVAAVLDVNVNTTDSKTGATSTEKSRLLLTKGDANPTNDGQAVEPDRFRGLVFVTVPSVGGVLGSGAGQGILVSLLIGIAVTWLVYEVMEFRDRRAGMN